MYGWEIANKIKAWNSYIARNDYLEITDQILTLIKEADWKSPEEWNKNEIKWMNIVQGMREANGTV